MTNGRATAGDRRVQVVPSSKRPTHPANVTACGRNPLSFTKDIAFVTFGYSSGREGQGSGQSGSREPRAFPSASSGSVAFRAAHTGHPPSRRTAYRSSFDLTLFFPLGVTTATLIAAVSTAATIGAFLAYLYYLRRSGVENAREEALALAETRGAIIADLQAQLKSAQRDHERSERAYKTRIKELEAALAAAHAESREQAYQTQRFYSAAFADLLGSVRSDLEAVPPNVDAALTRIRELLADERPAA